MTLVTDVLDRAARQVSVNVPTAWLSATADEHVELRDDFLLETVDDIVEGVDLPSPIGATAALSTLANALNSDGSRTFTMPAAFKRLQRPLLSVYDPVREQPCIAVTTEGEWAYLVDAGTPGASTFFRASGYEGNYSLTFFADPGASSAITVSYVTTYWAASSGGTLQSGLTDATDILLLPRRLVETGIIWRWRERRGLPYADKMNEYEMLKARLSNDARARRVVNMGQAVAARWQDRVPSYIPES